MTDYIRNVEENNLYYDWYVQGVVRPEENADPSLSLVVAIVETTSIGVNNDVALIADVLEYGRVILAGTLCQVIRNRVRAGVATCVISHVHSVDCEENFAAAICGNHSKFTVMWRPRCPLTNTTKQLS